jgi:hypothetical protein
MPEALDLVSDRDPLQRELAETRKRLAELKRRAKAEAQAAKRAGKTRATIENPEADWVWGAKAIGRLIGRSESQTHYLFAKGLLGDAAWKVGHKAIVASRAKLAALAGKLASET